MVWFEIVTAQTLFHRKNDFGFEEKYVIVVTNDCFLNLIFMLIGLI